MKQVCLLCERTAPDHNLYCQETYCPAEMSPTLLSYGEWLGDIEIIKPVTILRSAVLYEAVHQKKKVFLKVAHPGNENKERLKREAEFLRDVQLGKTQSKYLPSLLPSYAGTTIKQDAYGKTMLQGHLLYFYLFEYVEGETLRNIITENPQLWVNHICWIVISLAYAIAFLHSKGIYHYGLTPESLLVRFDDKLNIPRILLIDLGVVSDATTLKGNWDPFFLPPAYTAPELISTNGKIRADYSTDVHGLGVILYELLVGEPAYKFKLYNDTDIYRAVQRHHLVKMNRVEDVKMVADIAVQAVDQQVANRQQDATVLAKQLLAYFGEVPEEEKSRWPSLRTIQIITAALLAIAFLIALAVSLNNFAG
jgi:serine/threonine protein kinase